MSTSAPSSPAKRSPKIEGRSIVAGKFVEIHGRAGAFKALNPETGAPTAASYTAALAADVNRAAESAGAAAAEYAATASGPRAEFLERIAAEILGLGDALINTAGEETGLAGPRLISERDRTVFQLRAMAGVVREGSWVEAMIDHGDQLRKPLPKPDARRMLRPLGPVAVFGASNFPLAYSTAGTDTCSALAAGCPVIVKGHPAHPGTGELVAQAIADAASACRMPSGVFGFLHAGGEREAAVGQELVKHPAVRAVGFTGSFGGGMALAKLAGERHEPIPVFAEMGSTNPVFILPGALAKDARGLAERLFGSATGSAGQMCTCPGLIFIARDDAAETFVKALTEMFNNAQPQIMLSPRVQNAYVSRLKELASGRGVEIRGGVMNQAAAAAGGAVKGVPVLLRTTFASFAANAKLGEECFGPSTMVVVCDDGDQLADAAAVVQGSLTGSIFTTPADGALAMQVRDALARRVGRLIYNGVPTGVEVCWAMVHGGPFPSSNHPDTSAVGPTAMRRWCRPVCFQNAPDELLPPELREDNPLRIFRLVDGQRHEANHDHKH